MGLIAAVPSEGAPADINSISQAYVQLILGIGEHEPGYVDAYYGPKQWAEAAKKQRRTVPELTLAAQRLVQSLASLPIPRDALEARRRQFLETQLHAAQFRLQMIAGDKPSFLAEAQALFDVTPELKPLSSFDDTLKRIAALVPGEGELWERVDAFRNRFVIPKDRLDAVIRAAIGECRRRTQAHISLPSNEAFVLEFVTGKSWSGYNWYQGDAKSLIQINTDLPVTIDRALTLGCHEGYPGHHAQNVLLEERLTRKRGWREFSIYPLFSPQSLIAEGAGNFGIDLAFPGAGRTQFEATTLYPLAGLDPHSAAAFSALREATKDLAPAQRTIAAEYLDKKIDRSTALGWLQKYLLVSPARAEQSLAFIEQYRSYIINYTVGEELVRNFVLRGNNSQQRWRLMERVLAEPTLPRDMQGSSN